MTTPRPRLPQSSQLRNPMPDATDEGQKLYISKLEKRALLHTISDMRWRVCMELATGVPHDDLDIIDIQGQKLIEYVTDSLVRGLDISKDEARRIVREHISLANPSQVESPIQGLST